MINKRVLGLIIYFYKAFGIYMQYIIFSCSPPLKPGSQMFKLCIFSLSLVSWVNPKYSVRIFLLLVVPLRQKVFIILLISGRPTSLLLLLVSLFDLFLPLPKYMLLERNFFYYLWYYTPPLPSVIYVLKLNINFWKHTILFWL